MSYDGLGQRLSMTAFAGEQSVTTNYALDNPLSGTGGQVLAATAGDPSTGSGQVLTTTYLYGLGPVGQLTNAWAYGLPDGTNTQRQLVDANGEITFASSYTPWGDTLSVSGTGSVMQGYFGGIMDTATGLIYLGNGQYYDPSTGRFLSRNVNPNSTNPYVPWNGNPTSAFMAPLFLLALLYSRKKKRGKIDTFVILLVLCVGVSMSLAACGPGGTAPLTATATIVVTPAQTPTATSMATTAINGTPVATNTPVQTPTPCTPTVTMTLILDLDQYFASLPEPYAKMPRDWTISQEGLEFLKSWEVFDGQLYNDGSEGTSLYRDTTGRGIGYCTIGYGHVVHRGGERGCDRYAYPAAIEYYENGRSEAQATDILIQDAANAGEVVKRLIIVKLTQTQYDALVSLVINWAGLPNSEKVGLLNSGQYVATADHLRNRGPFTTQNNTIDLPVLHRRRAAEADLFLRLVNP